MKRTLHIPRPFWLLASFLLVLPLQSVAEETELSIDSTKSAVHWLGKKVSGQHDGTVSITSGTVKMNDAEEVIGGTFILDMNSISNKDIESPKWRKKLEDHLKSDDFFNIVKFPKGEFVITKSEPGEGENETIIHGKLTIKGITVPVTLPATIVKDDKAYTADGKVTIDRTKWDIRYNSGKWFDPNNLGDKLIYDEIEITVHIVAPIG
jgi:polyisoprenoid-binding protein YceI